MKITLEMTVEEFERLFGEKKECDSNNELSSDRKKDDVISEYARVIDCGDDIWRRDMREFEHNIRIIESYANQKLRVDRYLYLNDVYDWLGVSRTKAGAHCGWTYFKNIENPRGDNFVKIDIYQPSGLVNKYIVDFNVDGDIFMFIRTGGLNIELG